MPQFDTAAFFAQLFWLTVTFYLFYIVLFQTYLPGLTRILKARRKKIEFAQTSGTTLGNERQDTVLAFEGTFASSAMESREGLGRAVVNAKKYNRNKYASITFYDYGLENMGYVALVGSIRGQRSVIQSLVAK